MKKLLPVLLALAFLCTSCAPYSMDIADLDSRHRLSFLVHGDQYYLRTIDFAADTIADLPLPGLTQCSLVYGDTPGEILLLTPAQTNRVGFAGLDLQEIMGMGDDFSLCEILPDGTVSEKHRFTMDYDVYAHDGYALENYYEEFGWNGGEMRCHDDYRCAALSYHPDGRVAGFVIRKTDQMIVSHVYKDANGQMITAERKARGYTLGIEDPQGRWTPVLDFGEDAPIRDITHAGWIDGDHLLVVGCHEKDDFAFHTIDISSGAAEMCLDRRGKTVKAFSSEPFNSHITLSPDGRFAAYRPFQDENIFVADLSTGKNIRVFGKTTDKNTGETLCLADYDLQFWH